MANENTPWSFPDVANFTGDLVNGYSVDSLLLKEKENKINELNECLLEKEIEIANLRGTIEALQQEHEKTTNFYKKLHAELATRMPQLNHDVVAMTATVIRNMVQKITHIEIGKDARALEGILKELLDPLSDDGLITVELCSQDIERIKYIDLGRPVKYVARAGLSCGDVIVSSGSTCYARRIDDIINNIMSDKYEQLSK